ncbi:hypothetical protein N9043_00635 [bacterium]|nr:hypothetical protein [bacterium]
MFDVIINMFKNEPSSCTRYSTEYEVETGEASLSDKILQLQRMGKPYYGWFGNNVIVSSKDKVLSRIFLCDDSVSDCMNRNRLFGSVYSFHDAPVQPYTRYADDKWNKFVKNFSGNMVCVYDKFYTSHKPEKMSRDIEVYLHSLFDEAISDGLEQIKHQELLDQKAKDMQKLKHEAILESFSTVASMNDKPSNQTSINYSNDQLTRVVSLYDQVVAKEAEKDRYTFKARWGVHVDQLKQISMEDHAGKVLSTATAKAAMSRVIEEAEIILTESKPSIDTDVLFDVMLSGSK